MKFILLSAVTLLALSQVANAKTSEQNALERTGVAVICASETTTETEDVAVRLNKKLLALGAETPLHATNPVMQSTSGRNTICITVTRFAKD